MKHKEYEERLFQLEIDAVPLEPYVNMSTKIAHECLNGHVWDVKPSHLVHSKSGCPYCKGNSRKTTIEHLHEVAPTVFVGEYKNAHSKLEYSCIKGHGWSATPHSILNSIKQGATGCPHCAKNYSYDTEEYIKRINNRITCLEAYINNSTKILHRCNTCSHEWKISPGNVLSGYSCPECGGTRKKTHEEYSSEAYALGITVLQPYLNNKTALLHECIKAKHQIFTTPTSLLYKMEGCVFCKQSDPYRLYFIEFIVDNTPYFKVGVTRKTVANRVKTMGLKSGITYTVLMDKEYATYGLATYEEQKILKKYASNRITVDFVKNGNTEFFNCNVLENNNVTA